VHASLLVSDAEYASLAYEIAEVVPQLPLATLATISYRGEIVISELPENDVSLRTMIDLSAPQAIIYTSGTTGLPKGTIITYGMQWWNAVGSALNLGHSPGDRWLACLPLFHIGGLSILMRSVIYGISVMVHNKFDPVIINQAIFEDNITIISVVAVMLQRMLDALDTNGNGASYPSTLRCILLGGGPASYPLLESCMLRGLPVVQTYGLTEACSQAVTLSPADAMRKIGSAGRPLSPVQLRIMHDNRSVSAGEPGEIFLKGPTITPGYIDRPEATERAFQDGWFATGDIGYLDNDGYLYVLDRRADLIISGGENIYPAEIESILQSHPAIQEAGVCGQEDPKWGQVPIAFVVLKSGSTISAEELLSYTVQKLARYKQPRTIYFTKHLPRTSSGKLLRRELPGLLQTQHT
jgi:o-succinylbenzoate---CoA ligase